MTKSGPSLYDMLLGHINGDALDDHDDNTLEILSVLENLRRILNTRGNAQTPSKLWAPRSDHRLQESARVSASAQGPDGSHVADLRAAHPFNRRGIDASATRDGGQLRNDLPPEKARSRALWNALPARRTDPSRVAATHYEQHLGRAAAGIFIPPAAALVLPQCIWSMHPVIPKHDQNRHQRRSDKQSHQPERFRSTQNPEQHQ